MCSQPDPRRTYILLHVHTDSLGIPGLLLGPNIRPSDEMLRWLPGYVFGHGSSGIGSVGYVCSHVKRSLDRRCKMTSGTMPGNAAYVGFLARTGVLWRMLWADG